MARDIENDFAKLEWLDDGLIRITRTSKALESMADMTAAWDDICRGLMFVDRARVRMLIDTSAAPGRNDPAFERAFAPIRTELTRGFARCAVVVRMAVSRLQVKRHAATDGADVRVFTDADEALRWLRNGDLTDAAVLK